MPNDLDFHFVRKHLGRSASAKKSRTVDYWCEDPRFTTESESLRPAGGERHP